MKYKKKYIEYKNRYLIHKIIPSRFASAYFDFRNSLVMPFNHPELSLHGLVVQTGGNSYKWTDKGKTYTFEMIRIKTKDTVDIQLVNKKGFACIQVSIPLKSTRPVRICNLSYYEDCAKEGLTIKGGDKIFRSMLDYLITNKKVYNIKRIVLTDHSFIPCNNSYSSRTIKLAKLRMVTHNKTWYMKYGFRLYNDNRNKEHKYFIEALKRNNKMANQLKMTKFDLIKIVKEVNKEEKLNIDYKEIIRISKKYITVRDFINRLTVEFDKYCCLVNQILDILYDDKPGTAPLMVNFYDRQFYLDI